MNLISKENQVFLENIFDSLTDEQLNEEFQANGIDIKSEVDSLTLRVNKMKGEVKLQMGRDRRQNLTKAKQMLGDFFSQSLDPVKDLLSLFNVEEQKAVFFRDIKSLTAEDALDMLKEDQLLAILRKLENKGDQDSVE